MAATSKLSWISTEVRTHIGKNRERSIESMRHTMTVTGAFFNRPHMVAQYFRDDCQSGQTSVPQSLGSA